MIISHRHRFIFLRTRKTAGTSIGIALTRYCGPDDVVTPDSPADERIRASVAGPARNFRRPARISEVRARDFRSLLRGRWPERQLYWNHMPARLVRDHVGRDVWDAYFKFCFVRNPWAQAVSMHRWAVAQGQSISFSESIERPLPIPNWKVYTIRDEIAVDFVGRYERLTEDLAEALRRVGIDYDGWLPDAKRPATSADYRDAYTPELVEAVRRRHALEIERFGYEF